MNHKVKREFNHTSTEMERKEKMNGTHYKINGKYDVYCYDGLIMIEGKQGTVLDLKLKNDIKKYIIENGLDRVVREVI